MSARDTLACTTFKTLWVSPSGQAVWATNVLGHDNADAILSALDKAGYAVVPKEPTREMLNAAIDTDRFKLGDISPLGFRCSPQQMFNKAYDAMLKAAQEDSRG